MPAESFETLLWDLSAALTTLGADEVESQLARWLGDIAETMGIDRVAIWQFIKDTRQVRFVHVYSRSGATYTKTGWRADELPWFDYHLANQQRLLLPTLPDSLPIDAVFEREHCRQQQLKSALVVPLLIGGTLLGAMSFTAQDAAHTWTEPLLRQLEVLARILASALHRQQVEAALRSSEERLRLALEAAAMGTWDFDVAADRIRWSKNVAPIFGLQQGEFGGNYKSYVALIHPEEQQQVGENLRTCLAGPNPNFAIEHRTLWPDGSVHWVEMRGKVVRSEHGTSLGLLGTVVDITERRHTEQALRESEDQFRTIFCEAPIGLIYVNRAQRVDKANRAMYEFLGYAPGELDQVLIRDITHPDDVEATCKRLDALFAGLVRTQQKEKRYLKKSGEVVWGLLTATALCDKSGKVVCVLSMVENISARKLLEDQFRQAQKMDAFGQLAGGVAHDFNNLLTAINGYGELSLEQLEPDHFLRPNLEEIIKAGERAATLTRQLLAFSRKQVLRPKVLDLRFIIEDMNKLLRRLIGEDIKLVTTVQPSLGKVLADPGQIEQIVMNLAVNARDAMPLGGRLLIALENVYRHDEYKSRHAQIPTGAYVVLKVSDNGCGMTHEVQARIFEPFFSTKEPGRGTGLGLSTVYGIVSQSSGHIVVASEPGAGTRFEIYLPRVDQLQPQPGGGGDTAGTGIDWQDTPGGSETILLVEDDDSVRNMVLLILRDRGYDVMSACDGRAALLLSEKESRQIALLLTDVVMPKMSGRELADALRRHQPALKVIYMSGYAGDAIIHHGVLDAGVVLIEKPFTMDELLRRVREVLDEC